MRLAVPLLSTLALLALPASAAAAEEGEGKDYTTEIMLGLIIFLMVAMVVIGILEQRKSH